jgi:YbbR domain-containing protein
MEQKRYHIIIASVVFAVLMWISVNLGYEYTIVRQIPIALENMKEGKALLYPIPKKVTVRFKGYGWQLAALYLAPDVRYYIDISTLSTEPFTITSRDLPEHVRFPIAIQPLDVKPETLLLALDDYKEKRIPIIHQVVLICREGYGQVGPIRVIPESVTIGGAKNIIELITEWKTVYKKYDNQRTPINDNLPLEDPPSYDIDVFPSSVQLQVDIQSFAEKAFSGIPVVAKSTPSNREVLFIPSKMDIVVRSGIDRLANLSQSDFQVFIDYSTLLQDSSGVITPTILIPDEIKVVRRSPERFQFIIRKKL